MFNEKKWEKVRQSIREGALYSMEQVEHFSKVGKLKVQELYTGKKQGDLFHEIGKQVFLLINDGKAESIQDDSFVMEKFNEIKKLEENKDQIHKDIEKRERRGA